MCHPRAVLALVIVLALSACSQSGRDTAANSVDVGAAALRAQSDIDNYVAGYRGRPSPAPTGRVSVVGPTFAATAAATGLPDDAPPEAVVQRYVDAPAGRRYGEALALWEDGGAAAGMSEAALAANFAKYANLHATVGTSTDPDAGAGQRFVTVPVVITGTVRSGGAVRLAGPVVLHTVAKRIDSDRPLAHAWRIRSSEVKSQPATDARSPG